MQRIEMPRAEPDWGRVCRPVHPFDGGQAGNLAANAPRM
jgi:hypothetical protein